MIFRDLGSYISKNGMSEKKISSKIEAVFKALDKPWRSTSHKTHTKVNIYTYKILMCVMSALCFSLKT